MNPKRESLSMLKHLMHGKRVKMLMAKMGMKDDESQADDPPVPPAAPGDAPHSMTMGGLNAQKEPNPELDELMSAREEMLRK